MEAELLSSFILFLGIYFKNVLCQFILFISLVYSSIKMTYRHKRKYRYPKLDNKYIELNIVPQNTYMLSSYVLNIIFWCKISLQYFVLYILLSYAH